MRTLISVIILGVVGVFLYVSFIKYRRDKVTIALLVLICFIGSILALKFVNVNTIPSDIQSTVEELSLKGYVRVTDSDEVELNITGEWVNIRGIKMLGFIGEKMKIQIGGVDYEIGDSGIVSAIKVLNSIGLLD